MKKLIICENLKLIRINHKFTQNDVALRLRILRVVYNRYENGNRKIPLKILWDLADFYNISIDNLVGRKMI